MSDGWLNRGIFRIEAGGELPVVSVTRLPPELDRKIPVDRKIPAAAGEPGFGGEDSEPRFAAGSVTGYRWWALDLHRPVLLGMHDAWGPGENIARCLADRPVHPPGDVPARGCYCGFYAWWTVQPEFFVSRLQPVLGVIEGYGRTVTASKGFRCGKARILALCPLGAVSPAMAAAYPAARVYKDPDAMVSEFPPDPNYP